MNYRAHYQRLISRAKGRVLQGYREVHHILPRCLGGGNEKENLIDLTPEEHFVAHQLLVKMHPGHFGIATALLLMAGTRRYGNRYYGWIKRAASKSRTGTKHSDETKKKISLSSPWKGKKRIPFSDESKEKMSASQRGRRHSPETRAKIGAAHIGNSYRRGMVNPPESRARQAEKMKGNKHLLGHRHSVETRAKLAIAMSKRQRDELGRIF